jgi:NAD(P)-dependent dehydrogenase (short-subunit alcohol dehydrogenase family)
MAAAARAYTGATRTVTLITGANRGLGYELARVLLRRGGYHVIAAARRWTTEAGSPYNALDAAYAEASKTPSRHLGGLDFVEVDVASPDSRYALHGQLAKVLGTEQRVNVLVNNAGVYLNEWSPATFAKSMETNCIGPLGLASELVPFYAPDAHIVNVSTGFAQLRHLSPSYKAAITSCASIDDLISKVTYQAADSKMASEFVAPYKVSKAALNRGTQLLASKFKGKVRVSAVDPGWCKTDMYEA